MTPASHARAGRQYGAPVPARYLAEVAAENIARIPTGVSELDRVLGGGLVVGSVVLIGGDPGIGKSTLLLQALATIGDAAQVLYVSGEESSDQIALRARRLGLKGDRLRLLTENRWKRSSPARRTSARRSWSWIPSRRCTPKFCSRRRAASPRCANRAAQLVRFAKQTGTALFLVGHVTKEGTLAGPRVLEHMVDTVLYFEGDTGSAFRIIRAIKNRFGAVNEIGVFAMTETGLREVGNPSSMFLSRQGDAVPGSVVLATQEGTRPLLVEVQALVDQSHLANPRRVCVGLDTNRLAMLLAVLHRHAGIATYDQDVFVNVVGGVRVMETAADLAILAATMSSLRNRPLRERPGRLRRSGSGRRGAAGAARTGTHPRGGQARFQARAGAGRQHAEKGRCRHRLAAGAAFDGGVGAVGLNYFR